MTVNQYKKADALAFAKHKRAMMEAVQESSLGLRGLPTLISAIALGKQKINKLVQGKFEQVKFNKH